MPPTVIYTAGYAGQKPEDLRLLAEMHAATVADIRLSVRSIHRPEWSAGATRELLGDYTVRPQEGRYCRIAYWGNRNRFNGGPMELVSAEQGLRMFELLPERPVILLCACFHETTCHRSLVADLLRKRGYAVKPLCWADAKAHRDFQSSLLI